MNIFGRVFASVLLLILAACGSSDDDATPAVTESAEVTEVVTAEPAAVTEVVTEEAIIPVETEVVQTSADGAFFISVSYTLDATTTPDLPPAPEGLAWVVVVATLSNQGEESVTVNPADLTLVDDNGVRYLAEEPDTTTSPPLIGAELLPGEPVLGLARFAIAEDATAYILEWCPAGDCSQAIRSYIP